MSRTGVLLARLTLEHTVLVAIVALAFVANAGPMSDNSLFVHLQTGRTILDTGAIPRADPYSFTAAGTPWVVQSWLASVTYAFLEDLGGPKLVIVEHMALGAVFGTFLAALARTGTMLTTALAGASGLLLAYTGFAQRPLMFGYVLFAASVWLVINERRAWWLLPIAFVWTNVHASFPLALGFIGLHAVGSFVDAPRHGRRLVIARSARYAVTFAAGTAISALGPIGLNGITFPLRVVGERSGFLASITEWAPPNLHGFTGSLPAAGLAICLVVLIQRGCPWRYAAPLLVCALAGLHSRRFLPYAGVLATTALAHVMANGHRSEARHPDHRPSPLMLLSTVVVLVVVSALSVVKVAAANAYDLHSYPVAALDWMRDNGMVTAQSHIVASDTTGCYRILRDGVRARVFVDDRYDMYPVAVLRDFYALDEVTSDPGAILDRYDATAVVWKTDTRLVETLAADERWSVAWRDDKWSVFVPTTVTS